MAIRGVSRARPPTEQVPEPANPALFWHGSVGLGAIRSPYDESVRRNSPRLRCVTKRRPSGRRFVCPAMPAPGTRRPRNGSRACSGSMCHAFSWNGQFVPVSHAFIHGHCPPGGKNLRRGSPPDHGFSRAVPADLPRTTVTINRSEQGQAQDSGQNKAKKSGRRK